MFDSERPAKLGDWVVRLPAVEVLGCLDTKSTPTEPCDEEVPLVCDMQAFCTTSASRPEVATTVSPATRTTESGGFGGVIRPKYVLLDVRSPEMVRFVCVWCWKCLLHFFGAD